ncbi:MAG: hypothetical protein WD033_03210 [Nitrosopumilaceae archaeon]
MAYNEKEPKSGFSCRECDISFESKEKLNLHLQNHSEIYCETCPMDMAIRGIKKLFQGKNKK